MVDTLSKVEMFTWLLIRGPSPLQSDMNYHKEKEVLIFRRLAL